MSKIKEPAVANSFYSGDVNQLNSQIQKFKENVNSPKCYSRAVIVPHAGLIYSGQLAYQGINHLDRNIKNIFIFAPAHRVPFEGMSLSSYDFWRTPLGDIELNKEVNEELKKFGAKYNDEAHKDEHSIEIELPIIQSIFDNVKIIPVLIGKENPDIITKIIDKYYPNNDFGFVISSDLSHFLNENEAKKLDNKTAQMIETGDIANFTFNQACGAIGVYGLVNFANLKGFSLIRAGLYNSSLVTGDKSRIVGYGSWFLYEGGKNKFLKEFYSDYMLNLCKKVINIPFSNEKVQTNHDCVFDEFGACFVTLKKNGQLRGCIGSIIAYRPLISDLVEHAQNAAFKDPRFNPVSGDEVSELSINISLLSSPLRMNFKDEEDLLSQIVPNVDGIIIKDKNYQAVYLPSVWEELPDKKIFLNSLKVKAGLPQNYFSNTFEAYRFRAEYI